jgi:Cytochrome c554 and c-prime
MTRRTKELLLLAAALAAFLGWRFLRPLNIFIVTEAFERPISTIDAPAPLRTLHAAECAGCHREVYEEWRTTMHSQAWTDPYFQADWVFDGSQQICKNCHVPLDRQQEQTILGFRDRDKWDPILAPNPDFDPALQHEGVTCTACHLREGSILGVHGVTAAPHPVGRIDDPNTVCVRCHVVSGERWDTFFRFPPCGTVAEIQATPPGRLASEDREALRDHGGSTAPGPVIPPDAKTGGSSGPAAGSLGCVQCHMPLVERPLVEGGTVRPVRRHLWRGGHDPEMVKQGLEVRFAEITATDPGTRTFAVTLTNVGAAHYLPTGTPDRHLTVQLRLLSSQGEPIDEQNHTLRRTVMWRPFIVDLWDTRLPRWQPRSYQITFQRNDKQQPAAVEAVVRYHLLDEKRRQRIGYENSEPIAYEVFRLRLALP